jgi:chorismate dehydratase
MACYYISVLFERIEMSLPPASPFPALPSAARIGCVSFLNSKPLIDPLVGQPDLRIHFAVPSALQQLIESRVVSTALMSVVDFQTTNADLLLVPAGMIGCDGPTLTVRIFSRVPATEIRAIHGDTDSHTSVILAQVIMRERHGVSPQLLPFAAPRDAATSPASLPETMLLIGDKVVDAAPDDRIYSYQFDLGEEWKALTGLPFVFAMWMMRRDAVEGDRAAAVHVAEQLAAARRRGADLTEQLLDRYAAEKQWPRDLARRYFTEYLRYEVTPRARQGLRRFFEIASGLGLLPDRRPVEFLEVPG